MRSRPSVLRVLRVASGLQLYEVAEATNIDQPRLSRIERGLVAPTAVEVRRIIAALGPEADAALEPAERLLDSLQGSPR